MLKVKIFKCYSISLLLFVIISILYVHGCLSTNNLASGGIRGVAIDEVGKRLSGVKITVGSNITYSDINGNFSLDDIKPQNYRVLAEKEGYETQSRDVEIPSGTIVENLIFVLPSKGKVFSTNVREITSNSAVISYNTATPTTSWILYGSNALLENKIDVSTSTKLYHEIKVTNLIPATTYFYKIFVKDLKERISSSEIKTFTTLPAVKSLPPNWISVEKIINSNNLAIRWQQSSSQDILGYNLYKSKSVNGPYILVNNSPLKTNSYIDNDIIVGEKYYYRVTTISSMGDESNYSQITSFLVHGIVTSNVVWIPENNPYILIGDLWIKENATLIINSGVEVRINATDSEDLGIYSAENLIGIRVSGSMYVNANKYNPVVFTSNKAEPKPNSWAGIIFDQNSSLNTSLIKGVTISFSNVGLDGENGIPTIKDSLISYCREAGIKCRRSRADVLISDVEISNCATGILLASNTQYNVKIASSTVINCIYGIVSRDNKYSEIVENKIKLWTVSGIDVGNNQGSIVYKNLVAPSSNGSGIITRKQDEIRRNTILGQIGIEIRDSAQAVIRSNLILANRSRNCIGVLYNGIELYNPTNHKIQYNNIWNLQATDKNSYIDASGNSLVGIQNPYYLDPQLGGGSPFVEYIKLNFDFKPVGTNLKGKGYAGEDIGAYDIF